ncbi:MAG: hypothetical protein Q7O12_13315 [Deltaproteobacteria bacterium]|nr:hypothetical protein [Deltaproteobacteria bacterium]
MVRTHVQTREFLASRLNFLITTPEVLRLVNDITTCTVEWLDHPDLEALEHSAGRELFPCFTTYLQQHLMEVRGVIYPNLTENEHVIYHVIRLELADFQFFFRLRTTQTAFLLSPFHCRFLSMLFGRLVIMHLSLAAREQEGIYPFTPYSLEEQVVADYLQSLPLVPCATIKLDAQDNPYIGSMLYTAADLRRCGMLDKGREEATIRAWRLFKRLLSYSVEGERLFTGFAILSNYRPLDYYRQRWPALLWFHEANHTSLDLGIQALRQFFLNADGRSTFLAIHSGKIVGLLKHDRGIQRQLTSPAAWRSVLPLATVSHRGQISFWVTLKGRKNRRIRLSLLEYRQDHLHIPLFQDIFWQELERQLKEVCPGCHLDVPLPRLKSLLEVVRRSGHGAIFLLGVSQTQFHDPHTPIENQVRLAEPVPIAEPWVQHLAGLAKSDGAVIFNDRLEACQFRARLKPANICLLPDQDDLGSGMRHQVTREFSAYAPGVLGICVSQDSYISLYRCGKLVSRLY